MKKVTLILSRLMVLLAAVAFVACGEVNNEIDNKDPNPDEKPNPNPDEKPEPEPELTYKFAVEFVKATSSTATVKITTENIAQYAYVAETSDTTLTPELIFAMGEPTPCMDGEEVVELTSLSPDTDYVVLFAGATIKDEYYEEVVKVTFKTEAFTEELTIYDIDYMSFSAHFNFPKDKVTEGNVVKWGLVEFPLYYTNRMAGETDAVMMNLNDNAYHNYISESTTWLFNEENSYVGAPDSDAVYYDPIVPGQPMYLMFGEYAYSPEDHWGWGPGYYEPLFDLNNYAAEYNATGKMPDDAKFWTGYYRKEFVQAKEPAKMSAKPEITLNLTPMGGNVTVKLAKGAYGMCIGLMDTGTMLELLPLLNNQRSYIQWYITSYHSFMSGISFTAYEDTTIRLEDNFYMRQNTNYTLYVTTLGDELGSKQSYKTVDFTLPKPTKPAPTASVKGIVNPETNQAEHDLVWFNLKCTSGNAIAAKYLANYEREWAAMVNQIKKGYNLSDAEAIDFMIQTYGQDLTAEEVAAINLAEGWDVNFTTRPDATTVCGLSVMNDEGTWGSAIDLYRSAKEPAATPVQSTLFNDLKGEWTATTTIRYRHYHYCKLPESEDHRKDDTQCGNPADNKEHNYLLTREEPISSKVVIGEVGYEQTLPEEVYQLFFDASSLKTKEEVDAVYAQFKTAVDDFNTGVRNQNRILCQGFTLEYDADIVTCPIPEHTGAPDGKIPTKYASPYELFIADADTYSAYNYESPVYDFGPKWYLEIGADGKVTAPFNVNYFAPMAQWYENVYYFMGACEAATVPYMRDASGNVVNGHFPVEISADKNTITILPFKHTFTLKDDSGVEKTYTQDVYPQITRDGGNGQFSLYSMIVAPIVLTRNGAAAPAAVSASAPAMKSEYKSIYNVTPRNAPKSRTALPIVESDKESPKVVNYRVQTAEQTRESFLRVAEKRNARN